MRWLELIKLALAAIARRPLRMTLTCSGVGIATGALLSMVAFALGVQEEAEAPFRKFELVQRIDVTARLPGEQGEDWMEGALRFGRRRAAITPAQLAQVRALAGVELAYPEIEVAGVRLSTPTGAAHPAVSALPLELGHFAFVKAAILAGEYFSADGAAEILLGTEIVRQLGFPSNEAAVGATVTLAVSGPVYVQGAQFSHQTAEFPVRVAGVWGMQGWTPMAQSTRAYIPLALAVTLPGVFHDAITRQLEEGVEQPVPQYQEIAVRARNLSDVPRLVTEIEALGLHANAFLAQFDALRKTYVIIDCVMASVGAVALIIASLGILNTQLMSILERFREIGVCKALGATNGDVGFIFLCEAAVVGSLGGLAGLLLGYVVSLGIDFGVNQYALSQGLTEPLAAFRFPGWLLGGTFLFAVLMSIASGVYPALRAARLDPIDALRAE